jgi:hypothetical protein
MCKSEQTVIKTCINTYASWKSTCHYPLYHARLFFARSIQGLASGPLLGPLAQMSEHSENPFEPDTVCTDLKSVIGLK